MSKPHFSGYFMNIPTLWMSWLDFAVRTNEMLTASAFVITHRVDRIGKAGLSPSVSDIDEFTRMITEKNAAAIESGWALSIALMKIQADAVHHAWQQLLAPASKHSAHSTMATLQQVSRVAQSLSDAATAGLAPVHTRAVANRKRLSKLSS